jgi:hypothetical protein
MSFRHVEIQKQFIEEQDGVQCTYLAQLHGTKEPAILKPNGDQWWYLNGKLHRDNDKPAYISHDGRKAWFQEGVMHRDNGPAEVAPRGRLAYYQKGKLHREDGPAIIDPRDGDQWWERGMRLPDPNVSSSSEE